MNNTDTANSLLNYIRAAVPGLRGKALKRVLWSKQRKLVLKQMENDGVVRFVPGAGWIEN